MKKTITWIVVVVVVVLIALGTILPWRAITPPAAAPTSSNESSTAPTSTAGTPTGSTLVATALYTCDKGHTISASFYEGPVIDPLPGQQPRPNGSAVVSLDGATPITLAQTISADGARYSNGDPQIKQGESGAETLVFWSKGVTALIMRNNAMDPTYTNCATATK